MARQIETESETNWLQPGVKWIRERGGITQVAQDVFKVTFSDDPKIVRPALKKIGAPVSVYALINRALYEVAREYERKR